MAKNKVLVFSSDTSVISPLKESYDVDIVYSSKAALKKLEEKSGSVIIIDSDIKELDGISLYKEIKSSVPDVPVIMLSSAVTIPEAVETSRLGVADIIKKPFLKERLLESIKKNLTRETVRIKLEEGQWLFGEGHGIKALLKEMEEAVKGKNNIVIVSEAGIELLDIVKIIHDHSGKKGLAVIDMLPFSKEGSENIFWAMLQQVLADSDTVYFRNFGSVPEKQRGSILDYIKSRSVRGRTRVIIDSDLSHKGYEGWEKIRVPSLRERKEDMPALIERYVDRFALKHGKKIKSIGLDILNLLLRYSWPGNYRELECLAENAVLACKGGSITMKDVPLGSKMLFESLLSSSPEDLKEFKDSTEKNLVKIVFLKTGSADAVADVLDIPKARASQNIPE